MHSAVCDDCGKRCEVPFRPTGDKPIFVVTVLEIKVIQKVPVIKEGIQGFVSKGKDLTKMIKRKILSTINLNLKC